MSNCLNCGGLIMEPNKTYGYAGPVCHCPKDPRHQYQRPASRGSDPLPESINPYRDREGCWESTCFRRGYDAGLRASHSELLAEVKDLERKVNHEFLAADIYRKDAERLRAALKRIASLASYPLPTCNWEANMRLAQKIAREALGDREP